MTPQKSLDVKGSFRTNPFAELIVEIGRSNFSGSLRLAYEDRKTVIYFDKGKIVYGVSNSKSMRLFNVMLAQKKIDKKALLRHPNFVNDLEFARSLQKEGSFSETEVALLISAQIEAIIVDVLAWPDGDWHFNPLARLRSDVRYEVNTERVLINYARCVSNQTVLNRFRTVLEMFSAIRCNLEIHELLPHEAYVLSRFKDEPLSIEQLRGMCSLPESGLHQALYALWLGGILDRRGWNSAFSATKIGEILGARIVKVKNAEEIMSPAESVKVEEAEGRPEPESKAAELTISLEEYLQRVEGAKTHYDTLGLENDADITSIKRMYFGLAKLFHPDKFHRESPSRQKRIQSAFTELAHAYETLKESEAREAYNFKVRKEMEAREKRAAEGRPESQVTDAKGESALSSFQQAMVHLNDEEFEEAAVLLARAVHYSPENAQFHAYYGQALSAFEDKLHKAESELQTAVRLDPKNAKIRMMLVDFFIDMKMKKRAIGELNRFLEVMPANKDAARRLEKLTS